MDEKWSKILLDCPLFYGIAKDELASMLNCLQPKMVFVRKNQLITMAGERFTGLGILMDGGASVTKENPAGDRIILSFLSPGDLFGEMAAYAKDKVWPATIIAQKDCGLLFLPPEKIIGDCVRQCAAHKNLIINLLGIISEKALFLNKKLEYLGYKTIRSKISAFLLEQQKKTGRKEFTLPFKRHELADFLHVSRPSLSRELCRLRDEGIIDFHMSQLKIIDGAALNRMVE